MLLPLVRAATSPVDCAALILLLIIIVTRIVPIWFINLLGHYGYDYQLTATDSRRRAT